MESRSFLRENETYDDFFNRCNNLSLFDCSEEEMLWWMMGSRRLPLSDIVPWSIVLVVIFLTGVVGNVCVCVVIVRNPGLHTATNYYLFSLAVSDLLLLLFVLVVIFLTGVVGNVCVCVFIVRHPGLHTATIYEVWLSATCCCCYLMFHHPGLQ